MRAKELSSLLDDAWKAGQRVLIKGKPGLGKTDIVMQTAQRANADLVISHPAVSDPTDYKGMPAIINGGTAATFLPFGDLQQLINAPKLTIAFADDLGQAPPAVQAAYMQLLQGRRVNGHKISPHVIFCGATNDTTHMAGVSGLLEPVKSRWDTIVELECSLEDWLKWALTNNMPAELIAFIQFRPKLLSDFKPTRELKNSPCPRTVAAVGRWLNAGRKDFETIAGAAGEAFATELIGFLKMYAELPSIEAILLAPDTAPLPSSPAAQYAVTSGLAAKAAVGNIERVARYAARLPKEFEVCCIRDAVTRDPKLCSTPTFTHWGVKNQGVL